MNSRFLLRSLCSAGMSLSLSAGWALAEPPKSPDAHRPRTFEIAPGVTILALPDRAARADSLQHAPLAGRTRERRVPVPARTSGPALTPGPLLAPGSPIANRTTIVPLPIPGDTSRSAIARSKMMNTPRVGQTLVEAPPSPTSGWRLSGSHLYWDPGGAVAAPQQVDVFPEQRTELAPEYPKAARDAGIQGMVMVTAVVLADGTVGETRVVKSIPALDEAAVKAVKQLRFKPGTLNGKPVPVWVGVPVRFTIH